MQTAEGQSRLLSQAGTSAFLAAGALTAKNVQWLEKLEALARRFDELTPVAAKGRIPWQYGNTGGALGATDKFGNIAIQPGLSGRILNETVRHEGVHRFLSPRTGPLMEFRANVGMGAYQHSHLVRYLEEAIAETFASRNLLQGLRHPFHPDYGIAGWRLGIETAGYVGGTAGATYAGYEWSSGE